MVRVVITGSLKQFTGGRSEFELEAGNIRQLFAQLGELYQDMVPVIEAGLAVAIDGVIYQDALLQPIPPDSEVHLLPRIAGGQGAGSRPTWDR